MDLQKFMKSLRREFPGRNVVLLPPDDPDEIIVELGKSRTRGSAVAFIKRSEPHLHRITTETYNVETGSLTLFVNDESYVLHPGDSFVIKPGNVHYAESADGAFTRVFVTTDPPWSPEDHLLANQPQPEPS